MTRRPVRCLAIAFLVAVTLALSVSAQRGSGRRFGFGSSLSDASPVKYDGRFVIVRLWYPRYPGWSYDFRFCHDSSAR